MNMEKIINKIKITILSTLLILVGCSDYERTEVEYTISVNHQSLNMFIGADIQLTASPTNGEAFKWRSEDESVATVSNGLVTAISEGVTNIIVEKGDLSINVPVTVTIKIPLTDILLSEYSIEMSPKNKATILATMVPLNANDVLLTEFKWWSDNENIARVSQSGIITGVSEGFTKVYYQKGKFIKEIEVAVSNTRPFKGPHVFSKTDPLELFFRDFDLGGEGYAFHDGDSKNNLGQHDYRKNNGDTNSEPVEVESGGNIGYMNDGEWLLYTVEVHDAGTYTFTASLSGPNDGFYHLELNGEDVTGLRSAPANGSWGNFRYIEESAVDIYMPEGKHKIKFYVDKAGFNAMSMKFVYKE